MLFYPILTVAAAIENMSTCRQRYDKENEAGVNKHINLELYSMYVYTSMVSSASDDRFLLLLF